MRKLWGLLATYYFLYSILLILLVYFMTFFTRGLALVKYKIDTATRKIDEYYITCSLKKYTLCSTINYAQFV